MEEASKQTGEDTMPVSQERLAHLVRIMPVFTHILIKEWLEKFKRFSVLKKEVMKNKDCMTKISELGDITG